MRDTVLILTHAGDAYVTELVAAALAERGARAFRFDTDRFPTEVRLSVDVAPDRAAHRLRDGERVLDAADVRAVWARRVWRFALDPALDARFADACRRECDAALRGFLDGIEARWVNPRAADRAAESKLRQLRVAREVGLDVPATVVTNDPERARTFWTERGGEVVVKMQRPLSTSMGKADAFVRTSALREEDLEHLAALRHAPMVFQEKLSKRDELRVACVGARQHVGRIEAGALDWRSASPDDVRWSAGELDAATAGALDELRRRLGLVYGAADFVRTPDGRTVFLEINSAGEWGMLQRDLGLPIAEALADELLAPERGGAA